MCIIGRIGSAQRYNELVAFGWLSACNPNVSLVDDRCIVALTEFATDKETQTAGTAVRRKKWFEQVSLDG